MLTTVGIHQAKGFPEYSDCQGNSAAWKIVEVESDIRMYERWVTLEDGLSVRERKGEFEIQADVVHLAEYIMDVSKWDHWMNQVESARVIGGKTSGRFYAYTCFSVPQPFSQRDLVTKVTFTTGSDQKTCIIDMTSVEGVLPEYKGFTRVHAYQARWTLVPLGGNKVRVSFTALSGEPPAFPRWIQDPIIKRMFLNNLINLKNEYHV